MSAVDLFTGAIAILLPFAIGWSVGQASSCAVTAAKEIVRLRTARLLTGFILAGGAAGLISLPLAWLLGARAALPPEAEIGVALVAGGVLLAAGALINDACLFGTLARIAQGEMRFLAVPPGLFMGYALADIFAPDRGPLSPNAFSAPCALGVLLVVVSGLLVPAAWWALRNGPRLHGMWPLHWCMLLLGMAGSLLFVLVPGWTYSDAVHHAAMSAVSTDSKEKGLPLIGAALATILGALIAGWTSGRFRFSAPDGVGILRSIAGGAMMALGAWFVPGGNDNLLLWAVPGGSVSGLLAYLLMSVLILLVLWLRHDRVGRELIDRALGRG